MPWDIRSLPKVQPCDRKTELLCDKPVEQDLAAFHVLVLDIKYKESSVTI